MWPILAFCVGFLLGGAACLDRVNRKAFARTKEMRRVNEASFALLMRELQGLGPSAEVPETWNGLVQSETTADDNGMVTKDWVNAHLRSEAAPEPLLVQAVRTGLVSNEDASVVMMSRGGCPCQICTEWARATN